MIQGFELQRKKNNSISLRCSYHRGKIKISRFSCLADYSTYTHTETYIAKSRIDYPLEDQYADCLNHYINKHTPLHNKLCGVVKDNTTIIVVLE